MRPPPLQLHTMERLLFVEGSVDLRDLFGSDEAIPHGHATAYFDMAYKVSATAVHVISSGLPGDGWTPVPSDSVLAIDLGTREIEVLDPRAVPSAQ